MGKNINENAKAPSRKALRAQQRRKQRQIKTVVSVIAVVAAVRILIGILFAAGVFDYQPQSTYDVLITVKDYGSIHVELYGNDAPETVKHFLALADSDYYNGKSIFKLFDDLMYMGAEEASDADRGIKGEFSENGFENKISHKKGILSMARGEDPDSAYGQFFIATKNSPELDGKYAAFGKVTSGMEVIDRICASIQTDADGMIAENSRPIVTSIESHASHSH